jgi:hypothetical protein
MLARRTILVAAGAAVIPALAGADPPPRPTKWPKIKPKRLSYGTPTLRVFRASSKDSFDTIELKGSMVLTFVGRVAGSWRDEGRTTEITVAFETDSASSFTEESRLEFSFGGPGSSFPPPKQAAKVEGELIRRWSTTITRENVYRLCSESELRATIGRNTFEFPEKYLELLREFYVWT